MTGVELAAYGDRVELPDADAEAAARERQGRQPPGARALGRLAEVARWVAACQGACPPRRLERVCLVVVAADHGVAARDVSAQPRGATAEALSALVRGDGPAAVLAAQLDVGLRVVDLTVDADLPDAPPATRRFRVRGGSGDIATADALTVDQAVAALSAGVALADEAVDSGADLLAVGTVGVAATAPAAAVIGLLCSSDAAAVTGRGSGIDDTTWMRKAAAVRDAMRRGRPHLADPVRLLAVAGGADVAALTGFLLQAAARRTPVLLDGLPALAAGLVGQRVAYRSPRWWWPAQGSDEPGHGVALTRLGLTPLLDLRVGVGDGSGALVAVPVLRAATALLADPAPGA